MTYIARLRAQRVLTWYGILAVLGMLTAWYFIWRENGFFSNPRVMHGGHDIPLSALLGGAGFPALVIATILAPGLDRERRTAAIAFTRPLSRLAIAGRFLAVDAAAVAIAWAFGLLVILLKLAFAGGLRFISVDGDAAGTLAIFAAVTALWYGLIVVVAAVLPGRGGAIAGATWAFALVLSGFVFSPLPGPVHSLAVALTYLDPLMYLNHIEHSSSHVVVQGSGNAETFSPQVAGTVMALSDAARGILAAVLAAATLVAGTQIWAKREVTA